MRPHLFFTGDIGAGKSTAIAAALGETIRQMGGFLTRRHTDPGGKPLFFSLETPDGGKSAVFLDLTQGGPRISMEVFEGLGAASLQGNPMILDEIGGIELLSPIFREKLEAVLRSDTPVIGVVKGKNASQALAEALGLQAQYRLQTQNLWNFLLQSENTLVYSCQQYDETALALAQQWAREYCL